MPTPKGNEEKKIWKPWELETHGVSASFLSEFLRCRYQCKLAYREGWYSPARNMAYYFVFGSVTHYLLEHWRFAKTKPRQSKDRYRVLHSLAQDYYTENEEEIRGATNQQEINDMIALAIPTVFNYLDFYQDSERETKWIVAEQRIEVPYCYPDGLETYIKGYIDLVGSQETLTIINDSKTTGRIDVRSFKNAQSFSLQLNLYCLGWLYLTGKLPNIITYDIIRRSGTKRKQGEKVSEWTQRLAKDMKAKPDHWFKRVTHNVNEQEFNRWVHEQLHPIMRDVRAWQENNYDCYPNPSAFYYDQSPSKFLDAILYNDYTSLVNKKDESNEQQARKAAIAFCKTSKRKGRPSAKKSRRKVHRKGLLLS